MPAHVDSAIGAEIEQNIEAIAARARAFQGEFGDMETLGAAMLKEPARSHPHVAVRAMIKCWDAANVKPNVGWGDPEYRVRLILGPLVSGMLADGFKKDATLIDDVCRWLCGQTLWISHAEGLKQPTYRAIVAYAKKKPITPAMTEWLKWARERWSRQHKPKHKLITEVNRLLGEDEKLVIQPGEAWSDAAIADITASPKAAAWRNLVAHCKVAAGGTPTQKWMTPALALRDEIGADEIVARLLVWFPLVDKPRTIERAERDYYQSDFLDVHLEILKGLCWVASTIQNTDLARALCKLAISAYRKVPGVGPRAVRVGNAAVYSLGQMPGMDAVGQLAVLRVKVKFGTAQIGIEKALGAAAEREGLPREEIEELGVPTYGLTEVGKRVEPMGDFSAELVVSGVGDAELTFIKSDGKVQKSVPASLKEQFAEELKELKGAAKDIGAMVPAQRDRLDSLFLDNKTWQYAAWRERYLDHELVGMLARRLIWMFRDDAKAPWRSATFDDANERHIDAAGKPVVIDAGRASVRLWHPIESPGGAEEALAWRRFFEERQIRQPFKQAHREIYLLTDAERRTETYSNRYAAHIIRQHQFNALCGVRGWKNKLRLMVDAEYPPATRRLGVWNLRAEFWIEGAGDEYGVHTNEAGAYNLLTTDQVRFYRIDAAQASAHAGGGGYGPAYRQPELAPGLKLEEVPPLVFSEIMRDVDLFVGVCSVANNPEWHDGGPGGVHRDYWWGQSFGELSAAGVNRRELLERLIPRLKIGPVCSFEGHFLIVRGKLRTYKVHLGSGNILMQPNDEYLCIVPSRRADAKAEPGVFLPFEGDGTLSVILSKAFMLAEDDKIKDSSILHQIQRK